MWCDVGISICNCRKIENGGRKVLIEGKVGDSPIYKMSVAEEIRGRQFR